MRRLLFSGADSTRRRYDFHADVLRQSCLDQTRKRSRSFRVKDSKLLFVKHCFNSYDDWIVLRPDLLLLSSELIIHIGKALEASNVKQ